MWRMEEGVVSFLPLYGFQRSNPGQQVWQPFSLLGHIVGPEPSFFYLASVAVFMLCVTEMSTSAETVWPRKPEL